MELDLAAARAVMQARLLERAVHDPGPWTMEYGGILMPTSRFLLPDRAIFVAHLPEHCWLRAPESLTLHCRGELVASKVIEHPGDESCQILWEIVLPEPVTV